MVENGDGSVVSDPDDLVLSGADASALTDPDDPVLSCAENLALSDPEDLKSENPPHLECIVAISTKTSENELLSKE